MSEFTTRFAEHKFHDHFQVLIDKIENVKKIEGLTDKEIDTLIRTETIYNIVYSRISSIDPNLLSKNTLENLSQDTNIINEKLNLFIEKFDVNNDDQKNLILNQIDDVLDKVVIYITQIFQPLVPSEVEALKESIVTARQSLAQHNRYIREEYQDFRNIKNDIVTEITDFNNQIISLKTDVEDLLESSTENLKENEKTFLVKQEEYQNQFSEFKDSINQEIEKLIDLSSERLNSFDQDFVDMKNLKQEEYSEFQKEIKLEIESMIAVTTERLRDFEQRFSEKQEDRTEQFSSLQTERKEKFDNEIKTMQGVFAGEIEKLQTDFQEHKASLKSQSDDFEAKIQTAKEELYKLIEVAGNDVMSDGYAKYANKAANLKYVWQTISVIFLLGLVWAAYSIIPTLEQEYFDWSTLAARSLLTVSVAALAGFTIRQAHLSHIEEQRNREMQLKLGSIEPYLKNFDIEKRNEIKESLVIDYFSKERKLGDSNVEKEEVNSESEG